MSEVATPPVEPDLMVELRGVHKRFGQRPAVIDLNLGVPRGCIFGLLGHNGAGKSTTIGMLLGQVWPTAGEVRLCGHDVLSNRTAALRRVGAIFESPSFYDYLTARQNLEILSHYTAATPRARILEVLDWVGLTGRENARVRTFSHGMRTRLALAQALLPDPEMLILDEPADGLDPEGLHEMRATIQRLQRELGLTLLLSSHLLVEVEQLCTRIAVLRQGRLVFEGTIRDIRDNGTRMRIRVDDLPAAVRLLESEKLARAAEEEGEVLLEAGVGSEAVIRLLVERGVVVYEAALTEQTLEAFYLSLIGD